MDYTYSEFDGRPFPTPDSLFPAPNVIQFILQHGQDALDAMENIDDQEGKEFIEAMIEAGLLERDAATGELRLTPRMLRGIEHRALLQIFEGLKRSSREGHPTLDRGRGDERTDGGKPYEFGDPISELDVAATLRNTLARTQGERGGRAEPPLHISPADFEIHQTESHADVATCILLDMSGSMMRWGRFYQAKRVALGMTALIRQRFPMDSLDFVGFYSLAQRIAEKDLPLLMPKPVSVHDYQVRLRIPLEQAQQNPRAAPQHFTNLQLGLRLARQTLARKGAANKQIFIITDGQPTAHVEPASAGGAAADGGASAGSGEMLYLLYPPSPRTADATLKEALLCRQQGIHIASFALIEDYWGMEWVNFVDQMTRLTRGVAFYCSADDLSSTVIESYLSGRRRKSFIA